MNTPITFETVTKSYELLPAFHHKFVVDVVCRGPVNTKVVYTYEVELVGGWRQDQERNAHQLAFDSWTTKLLNLSTIVSDVEGE